MATLRVNNLGDVLGTVNPMTLVNATTQTATWPAAPANMPAVNAPDILKLTLEPNTAREEIVYVTAYTPGATSASVDRAAEGPGVAIAHNAVAWANAPTVSDFPIPAAGAQGQALVKNSANDFDLAWASQIEVFTQASTPPSPRNQYTIWIDPADNAGGAQGPQGSQGPQGAQGTPGLQGPQGANGSQGAQGAQGTSVTGPQGAQGATGTQGAAGAQGTAGTQGTQGTQGHQGYQGTQGVTGATGGTGPQGTQGAQGNQGTQGAQGTGGSLATYSTTLTSNTALSANTAVAALTLTLGAAGTYLIAAAALIAGGTAGTTLVDMWMSTPTSGNVPSTTISAPGNGFVFYLFIVSAANAVMTLNLYTTTSGLTIRSFTTGGYNMSPTTYITALKVG
jgi:hypothetical protein